MEAAVKAVEALDRCIDQVAQAVESVGGQLLITADHGNAEQMRDPATGQATHRPYQSAGSADLRR